MTVRDVLIEGVTPRWTGVVVIAVLAGAPAVAAAEPGHRATAQTDVIIALGNVYGGLTPQQWPMFVEVNDSHGKITEMVTGLRLQCTSGLLLRLSDGYVNLRIRRRSFSASFGPEAERLADGTTATSEGSVRGRFNRARTRVSGTWTFKVTFSDAAGTVTDTCDSGAVHWTARQ